MVNLKWAVIQKAINYLSFPGGLDNAFPISEAIAGAKAHGYEALELCVGDSGVLTLDATEEECRAIRREAESAGIALPSLCSGLYWDRSLGDSDPARRARAKTDVEKMLQIASWLGARTLLVIPGAVDVFFLPERPVQIYDEVFRNATQGMKELIPVAERCGVRMGVENVWNKFLLSSGEMAWFIDQLDSPWVGAYVDVGNVLPFGFPEHWLRALGKRVVGIHFKDFRRAVGTVEGFVDLLEGDVDWPEVMAAIREIGYAGPIAAEMIPGYRHHSMVRIANASRAMDAILGKG